MQIIGIKWNGHPVLGDLELNFLDRENNIPYKNILFVGENGSGKTTILETISTFLNGRTFEHFEYIDYIVDGQKLRAEQPNEEIRMDGAYVMSMPNGTKKKMYSDYRNKDETIDNDPHNIRFSGCVLSKARADYNTKKIDSTKTSTLDTSKHDRDDADDFTSLKQLLVDIYNQDCQEYTDQNKTSANGAITWDTYYPNSKMHRFQEAFDGFFDRIKFDGIKDIDDHKEIYFTKNDNHISIDNLSTGEKQVVFRGCHLLRNLNQLTESVVLVDEPELSMHPKWAERILAYYKDLFTAEGNQSAQLFFASHSVHVAKEALKNPNSDLVIILADVHGSVEAIPLVQPQILPTPTNAETNYLAFDLPSTDYHIELYGYLQYKERLRSVKDCDEHILTCGEYDAETHFKRSAGLGTTTYDTLPTFIRNQIHHPDGLSNFSDDDLRTSIELLVELCR